MSLQDKTSGAAAVVTNYYGEVSLAAGATLTFTYSGLLGLATDAPGSGQIVVEILGDASWRVVNGTTFSIYVGIPSFASCVNRSRLRNADASAHIVTYVGWRWNL